MLTRNIKKLRNQENMPKNWSAAILLPIHKKVDKAERTNYRRIAFPNEFKVQEGLRRARGSALANIVWLCIRVCGEKGQIKQIDQISESVVRNKRELQEVTQRLEKEVTGLQVNEKKTNCMS